MFVIPLFKCLFFHWQVNGISLLGENHKDVVNILKELPIRVAMVCCRAAAPPVSQSILDVAQLPEQVLLCKQAHVSWVYKML